jgi:hypothetical protein
MFALRLHFHFASKNLALYLGCLLTLTLCTSSGCSRSEPIRSYAPSELERGSYDLDRMLVAIVPIGESTWFFKLQGKDEPVYKQTKAFNDFLRTVRLPKPDNKEKSGGEPTWSAPPEWQTRQPSSEMIFRSYVVPQGPLGQGVPLTLDISMLPTPETGVDDRFLLQNINRWCMQYNNEGISEKEVPEFSEKIDLPDLSPAGGGAWIVNLSGYFTGRSGMARPQDQMTDTDQVQQLDADGNPVTRKPGPGTDPHAGVDLKPNAGKTDGGEAPDLSASRVKVSVPAGWKKGKESSFIRRDVSLAVVEGNMVADISIMALPADANDLATNITRWRGQVGLPKIPDAEIVQSAQKITVDGTEGHFVDLAGTKETILAAMIKKGTDAWFFKLSAPSALAAKEKAKFEEFVKSAKLP